jgi:hypothetical protein
MSCTGVLGMIIINGIIIGGFIFFIRKAMKNEAKK